jgi:hypothetical protein
VLPFKPIPNRDCESIDSSTSLSDLLINTLSDQTVSQCQTACDDDANCFSYSFGRKTFSKTHAGKCKLYKQGCKISTALNPDFDYYARENIEAPNLKPEMCTHKIEFSQDSVKI